MEEASASAWTVLRGQLEALAGDRVSDAEVAAGRLRLRPSPQGTQLDLFEDETGMVTQLGAWRVEHDGPVSDPLARGSALDLAASWLGGALWLERARVGERLLRTEVFFSDTPRAKARRIAVVAGAERFGDRLRRTQREVERHAVQGLHRPTGVEAPPWAPWIGWGGHVKAEAGGPRQLVIDGELDLHNFEPREVGRAVRSYIEAAAREGRRELRIVHGKGKGVLRRTVHVELGRNPSVERFELAGHARGSWGATLVWLRHEPKGGSEAPELARERAPRDGGDDG